MPDSTPDPANAITGAACEAAFGALKTYDAGSARASLLPLDQAVTAALDNMAARAELEARLIAALQAGGSAVAREYLCSKLALVGSASAVPALAALLGDGRLSTAARNALQAMADTAASKALRKKLPAAEGFAKVGIINSLGARRDADAVGVLTDCLRSTDSQVAVAAAAALGEIGTAKAGRALRAGFNRAPESLRRNYADALLVCAERLRQQNRKTEAVALLKLMLAPGLPAYIQQSAQRGMPQ